VDTALRERTFRGRVQTDVAGGMHAWVHGTPTFFVDGERLVGHWRQLGELVPEALGR
jgi:protein-disulfide isomerase